MELALSLQNGDLASKHKSEAGFPVAARSNYVGITTRKLLATICSNN